MASRQLTTHPLKWILSIETRRLLMPGQAFHVSKEMRISAALILLLAIALTLAHVLPAKAASTYTIKILSAQSTTRMMTGTTSTQVVQVLVQNTGTGWFTPSHPATLKVKATRVT